MSEAKKVETAEATVLQIRKIGNSLGLILPKELLVQLGFGEGDRLEVVRQPEGGLKLQRHDDLHARAMAAARQAMKDYAGALRELAK
ncbi:AbrB/MazE/SpoVT family DNA-binding domain-containing protein [Bosea sp. (in: a-proteobacteria)]|uniref:AbrB/MazE/SpoVT family DNA-binding domain-containing protein n=1 Tax=Bosea sp. (in: a-proteobacteria) TaxID=1871050 RepID=UPI002618C68F|nr:AbrB/MazE/SpoVT family DNA-binding domain-containing protein [Bosea sp. (in: a-proteobacteria)]MCO5091469.1 AbrB/MazE/SpoVT family DNA-binding domain-containing protein [Bosea sp. (in: a-proteobacteria)]